MTSTPNAEQRCRVIQDVVTRTGRVERFSEGRIHYVSENLGRLLIIVDWDRGGSAVLFPEELQILAQGA